ILGFLAEVRFEVGICSACALLFPAPVSLAVPRLVKAIGFCLRFSWLHQMVSFNFCLRFGFHFPGLLKLALYPHLLKQIYGKNYNQVKLLIGLEMHKE
ncbi:MAG TPA: hypothetical protein VIN10_07385, partial [Bacteroidales bacterium]